MHVHMHLHGRACESTVILAHTELPLWMVFLVERNAVYTLSLYILYLHSDSPVEHLLQSPISHADEKVNV